MRSSPFSLITVAFVLAACGDVQDPDGAVALWDRLQASNYRSFARAPGYETRQSSLAPHGDEVDIYVNGTVQALFTAGTATTTWPVESLIVKDGFENEALDVVAAMEKRADGWYWAEWDAEGNALYSGHPEVCTDCHQSGADFVKAFDFPR